MRISLKLAGVPPLLERLLVPLWVSLNMDITEINTLNQEGVENLQATLRACGELETQAGRLRLDLVDVFAAAVVALARIALGILVGQAAALRLHDPLAGRCTWRCSTPATPSSA